MGFEVVLTRDKDVDVSVENRSAIANNRKAGLFISIHANGAVQKKAAGSETFFLSLNATDEETRRLAYLENNSSALQSRIDPSSDDDLMMILWDMAQTAYIKQSSRWPRWSRASSTPCSGRGTGASSRRLSRS